MGRRPKPTALKLVDGNPGKRPLNHREPKPKIGTTPPNWISKEAKTEWRRLYKHLAEIGLLTKADRQVFTSYCIASGRMARAERKIEEQGEVVETSNGNEIQNTWLGIYNRADAAMADRAKELGLTPAARSKVQTQGQGVGPLDLPTNTGYRKTK